MSQPAFARLRWCSRFFGDDVADQVFAPLLADWAHDLRGRSTARSQRVAQVRWLSAFARTVLVMAVTHLVWWRVPRAHSRAVLRTIAACVAGGVALPFLVVVAARWPRTTPFASIMLLVNLATIAGPLALGPGAMRLARADDAAPARRWMLAGLTLCTAVLQLGVVGWGLPALSDLVFAELTCTLGVVRTPGSVPLDHFFRPDAPRYWWTVIALEVAQRLVWVALPAAIAVFAWRLGSQPERRGGRWVAAAWGIPALLLLVPLLVMVRLSPARADGLPMAFARLLPLASLLVMAWRLGSPRLHPASAVAAGEGA